MSDTKFTPGPWAVDEAADRRSWGYIYPTNGEVLTGATRPAAVAKVCGSKDYVEDRANARLIAAAPDLYEALLNIRALAAYITPSEVSTKFGEIAQSAIDKAEGK